MLSTNFFCFVIFFTSIHLYCDANKKDEDIATRLKGLWFLRSDQNQLQWHKGGEDIFKNLNGHLTRFPAGKLEVGKVPKHDAREYFRYDPSENRYREVLKTGKKRQDMGRKRFKNIREYWLSKNGENKRMRYRGRFRRSKSQRKNLIAINKSNTDNDRNSRTGTGSMDENMNKSLSAKKIPGSRIKSTWLLTDDDNAPVTRLLGKQEQRPPRKILPKSRLRAIWLSKEHKKKVMVHRSLQERNSSRANTDPFHLNRNLFSSAEWKRPSTFLKTKKKSKHYADDNARMPDTRMRKIWFARSGRTPISRFLPEQGISLLPQKKHQESQLSNRLRNIWFAQNGNKPKHLILPGFKSGRRQQEPFSARSGIQSQDLANTVNHTRLSRIHAYWFVAPNGTKVENPHLSRALHLFARTPLAAVSTTNSGREQQEQETPLLVAENATLNFPANKSRVDRIRGYWFAKDNGAHTKIPMLSRALRPLVEPTTKLGRKPQKEEGAILSQASPDTANESRVDGINDDWLLREKGKTITPQLSKHWYSLAKSPKRLHTERTRSTWFLKHGNGKENYKTVRNAFPIYQQVVESSGGKDVNLTEEEEKNDERTKTRRSYTRKRKHVFNAVANLLPIDELLVVVPNGRRSEDLLDEVKSLHADKITGTRFLRENEVKEVLPGLARRLQPNTKRATKPLVVVIRDPKIVNLMEAERRISKREAGSGRRNKNSTQKVKNSYNDSIKGIWLLGEDENENKFPDLDAKQPSMGERAKPIVPLESGRKKMNKGEKLKPLRIDTIRSNWFLLKSKQKKKIPDVDESLPPVDGRLKSPGAIRSRKSKGNLTDEGKPARAGTVRSVTVLKSIGSGKKSSNLVTNLFWATEPGKPLVLSRRGKQGGNLTDKLRTTYGDGRKSLFKREIIPLRQSSAAQKSRSLRRDSARKKGSWFRKGGDDELLRFLRTENGKNHHKLTRSFVDDRKLPIVRRRSGNTKNNCPLKRMRSTWFTKSGAKPHVSRSLFPRSLGELNNYHRLLSYNHLLFTGNKNPIFAARNRILGSDENQTNPEQPSPSYSNFFVGPDAVGEYRNYTRRKTTKRMRATWLFDDFPKSAGNYNEAAEAVNLKNEAKSVGYRFQKPSLDSDKKEPEVDDRGLKEPETYTISEKSNMFSSYRIPVKRSGTGKINCLSLHSNGRCKTFIRDGMRWDGERWENY